MANGNQPQTEHIKYWKMQGLATQATLFYECSMPSMTLTANDFKVWDQQSKPQPLPVGVQASFGEVTLKRLVDTDRECYRWISEVAQKQANSNTVKDLTLIACNADGNPVTTWVLKGAYPVRYEAAGMAAGGSDVLTESFTVRYAEAQLDGKGGLTGAVS